MTSKEHKQRSEILRLSAALRPKRLTQKQIRKRRGELTFPKADNPNGFDYDPFYDSLKFADKDNGPDGLSGSTQGWGFICRCGYLHEFHSDHRYPKFLCHCGHIEELRRQPTPWRTHSGRRWSDRPIVKKPPEKPPEPIPERSVDEMFENHLNLIRSQMQSHIEKLIRRG